MLSYRTEKLKKRKTRVAEHRDLLVPKDGLPHPGHEVWHEAHAGPRSELSFCGLQVSDAICPDALKVKTALTMPSRQTHEINVPTFVGLKIVEIERRIFPKPFEPVSSQSFFPSDRLRTATVAADHGIIGVHSQTTFDIPSAIGTKPINRGGHRVKGHVPTSQPFFPERSRTALIKTK
jgi:hypothetical protein